MQTLQEKLLKRLLITSVLTEERMHVFENGGVFTAFISSS